MSFYRIKYYPMRENQYQHLYFPRRRGGVGKPDENAADILKKIAESEKGLENLSRSRRTIRDIILCNPFEYFCTFTFNQEKVDRYNFKLCKKKITKIFDNYKNRYAPNFQYIIVPEFHKDGGVHFHGMVRGIRPEDFTVPKMIYKRNQRTDALELVPNTKKYVDWAYYSKKLGFFSCSKIKDYEKCAKYVSKYITKDLMNMELGQRVFMASQNLNRPELVFDADDIPLMFRPDFENDFVKIIESNDHFGMLPEWWQEYGSCSELREPDAPDRPLIESEIFFPRLTGKQLDFDCTQQLAADVGSLYRKLMEV